MITITIDDSNTTVASKGDKMTIVSAKDTKLITVPEGIKFYGAVCRDFVASDFENKAVLAKAVANYSKTVYSDTLKELPKGTEPAEADTIAYKEAVKQTNEMFTLTDGEAKLYMPSHTALLAKLAGKKTVSKFR